MPNNFAAVIDARELKVLSSELDASEFDNVASGVRLAAGPIPLKRGPARIAKAPNGTTLLIYQGGRRVDTLRNRSVHTLSFPPGNRLEQYIVDIRQRTLALESRDELYTRRQDAHGNVHDLTVSLTLHVGYEVSDPVFIIEKGDRQPLTTLLTRTIEAAREAIDGMDYQVFKRKGELGGPILRLLQEWERESPFGIRVNNVSIREIGTNSLADDIDVKTIQTDANIGHESRTNAASRQQKLLDVIASNEQTAASEAERRKQELLDTKSSVVRTSIDKQASRRQDDLDAALAVRISEMSGVDVRYIRNFLDHGVLTAILDGENNAIKHQAEILKGLAENPSIGAIAMSSSFPEIAELFRMQHPPVDPGGSSKSESGNGHDQNMNDDYRRNRETRLAQNLEDLDMDPELDLQVIDNEEHLLVQVTHFTSNERYVEIWFQGLSDLPDTAPDIDVMVDGLTSNVNVSWKPEAHLADIAHEIIWKVERTK